MSENAESTGQVEETPRQEQAQEQSAETKARGQKVDAQGRNAMILLDLKKGTFKMVSGKDSDGKIKTGPENDTKGPFAEVTQGDMIDNFLKNYRRQADYPTGLKAL